LKGGERPKFLKAAFKIDSLPSMEGKQKAQNCSGSRLIGGSTFLPHNFKGTVPLISLKDAPAPST